MSIALICWLIIGFIRSLIDIMNPRFDEGMEEASDEVGIHPKNPKLYYLAIGSLIGASYLIIDIIKWVKRDEG